jgi:predicted AAA+ superfamily ATPase
MEIKREHYIEELKSRMHNGLIKVITGIRRSGKSYLLFQLFYKELLRQGVRKDHILLYSMEGFENKKYRNPETLLEEIHSRMIDEGDYYIFLDEVQMLDEFEEVLNSLLHISSADIYVTGSNSRFLSKDVITEFRGRGDELHIYPFTFKEFMEVYPGDPARGWDDYINYGGLPLTLTMDSSQRKVSYLTSLCRETYLKDIIEHNRIRKTQELEDLIRILASSIGSFTNPSKIMDTFQSRYGTKISLNTIKQYIDFLSDAFMVNTAHRYDVKGRKYIGSPVKYYFEDLGMRNALLGFRQVEEPHLMENVIYNELRYRGYSVDVGAVRERRKNSDGNYTNTTLEVDFVANQGGPRIYIQSALSIPDEEKLRQEKASLLALNDSFPKIIIVKDQINPRYDEDGLTMISLFDFLLGRAVLPQA